MRSRMLAALQQKQRELAGGAFNPVRAAATLYVTEVPCMQCCWGAGKHGVGRPQPQAAAAVRAAPCCRQHVHLPAWPLPRLPAEPAVPAAQDEEEEQEELTPDEVGLPVLELFIRRDGDGYEHQVRHEGHNGWVG